MPVQVTEEEIQAELEEMKRTGKNHTPRNVRGSFFTPHRLRVMIITVLVIAILICAFVWISNLKTAKEKEGYIININDLYEGGTSQDSLVLAFDPTFDEQYKQLVGLGYGDVAQFKGGSMLALLGTDMTMFAKFQDFALNADKASQYEGNAGQANFDEYYCNKYYLKNTGDTVIKFRLNLKVTQNINGALHAARFMIVEGNSITGYDYQIFATPNKTTGEKEIAATREIKGSTVRYEYFANPYNLGGSVTDDVNNAWLCDKLEVNPNTGFYQYTSCDVDTDGNLTNGEYYTILPGETVCYTICVWFEGSDPDHNNNIIGGGISFTVDYETEDYVIYLCEREKELQNA